MTDTFSLDKFKPKTPTNTFDVDETLEDKDLVFSVWEKLLYARRLQDLAFISMGKLLKLVRDRQLYKFLDYESFSQFLASEELAFSREKAYGLIRVYELYVEHLGLSPEKIDKIGVTRLMGFAPVVTMIGDKQEAIAKLEEISSLRHGDYIREIKKFTNQDGRPEVYWSEEANHWICSYYENTTHLISLGQFEKELKDEQS